MVINVSYNTSCSVPTSPVNPISHRNIENDPINHLNNLNSILNLQIGLKLRKIKIWGCAATTFESKNLKIEKYLWKWAALRWKSAINTSFRRWNRTVKIGRSQNNWIWKSYNFAKNWPKMAEKWVKMIFPDHGVNTKVVANVEKYLNMKLQPIIFTRSRENAKKKTQIKMEFPDHGVNIKVVDNGPLYISGKLEACNLKTFWEKSILAHIDCSQIEKWPKTSNAFSRKSPKTSFLT